jgi:hypothetical protein
MVNTALKDTLMRLLPRVQTPAQYMGGELNSVVEVQLGRLPLLAAAGVVSPQPPGIIRPARRGGHAPFCQRRSGRFMDENEQKQQLSIAYLHTVASAAGFACQAREVDDDSIDRTIVARGWLHEEAIYRSPKIDIQLKSLAREPLGDDETSFTFRLNRKNYDELRHRAQVLRLLVVLLLPRDPQLWVEQDHERMVSRYAAYYVSLAGMGDAPQKTKVPVEVPGANLFSVDALRRLMEQAARGVRRLQ